MIEAISPTVFVSISKPATIPKTTRIATSEAGTTLVSLGKPQIINIVNRTRPSRTYMGGPVNQLPAGSLPMPALR